MGFRVLSRSAQRDSKEFKIEIDPVATGLTDLDEFVKGDFGLTAKRKRCGQDERRPYTTMDSSRVHRAGVTAYLLYNGSATYVQ